MSGRRVSSILLVRILSIIAGSDEMSKRVFSLLLSTLLVFSLFPVFQLVEAVWTGGAIYIKADGSIEPASAPITTRDRGTYTLTDNIQTEGIVIERDNIVLDGNGYTVTGQGRGYGIRLENRRNVIVRNLKIEKFNDGIRLKNSRNITITGNTIANNMWSGIYLYESSGNTITGNTLSNNGEGIYLSFSDGNRITGNVFSKCGLYVYDSYSNVVEGNSVNGRPLVYLENARDVVVRDAGQVVVVKSVRVRVENLNLSNTTWAVELWKSSECTIANNTITNNREGIYLVYSSGNTITGNILSNNREGINLVSSSGNTITGNTLSNNGEGIYLRYSSDNRVTENKILNNNNGIYLWKSSGNRVFLNNFIGNVRQVSLEDSGENVWDDGSRGNFWSDYKGSDVNNDGIGDTPYTIDEKNVDRYPLINPYEVFPVKVYSLYGTTSGEGRYTRGSTATISVSPVLIDHGNGTRRVFSGWYDEGGNLLSGEPVFSFTVDKPFIVTAGWDTEYRVEAYSPYGSATGSNWYKRGSTATISISPATVDVSFFMEYVFEGWVVEGELVSVSPVYSFTVDKPVTLTASWGSRVKLVNVLAVATFLILLLLIVVLVWRSRGSTRARYKK
ncbi:MAG: NosD domain-containing protein [Thermofilaceae archaeon]